MLRITTFNCNGIRSSIKKGLAAWIAKRKPDILCLQEIRAKPEDLPDDWAAKPCGMHAAWLSANKPGYSGVAILSRKKPDLIETKFGADIFDSEARWLRADFGKLTVISLYLHSGTSGEVRQDLKYKAMDLLYKRMLKLQRTRRDIIIAGDFNIAHTQKDIRNWRSNQKNSGFLPQERDWVSKVLRSGKWFDVFRKLDDRDGRYTWWSQRGAARANDVGWRIDYQLATAALASRAQKCQIDKDPILSDHAPFTVSYS